MRTHGPIVRAVRTTAVIAVAALVLGACGESASETGRRMREKPGAVTTAATTTTTTSPTNLTEASPPTDGDEIRPAPE